MRTDLQAPAAGLAGVRRARSHGAGAGLDAIAAAMAAAGIARATVDYHGWRDGGTVDVPAFVDTTGAAVEALAPLRDLVVSWIKAVLPGGWKADAGSAGTATIDPAATPRARFDHAWNVESLAAAPFAVLGATVAGRLRRRGGPDEDIAGDDRLEALCATLRALGVAAVLVGYTGYGDEGYVEDVQVEPEALAIPDALRQQIEDWACERLPAGWEIGAGSQGAVAIRVDRGRARFDHEDHTERSEDDPFTID
jgi:hypothetical protein